MKRAVLITLAAALLLPLSACSGEKEAPAGSAAPIPAAAPDTEENTETEAPPETEAAAETEPVPGAQAEEEYREDLMTDDPMRDFVPAIRLAVCSDVHITDTTNERAARLGKLFDTAYRYADAHPTYKTLDAVLMAGDITNNGWDYEYNALNAVIGKHIRPETQLVTSMGNHEWSGGGPDVYLACMGGALDSHVVINGFHIIAVSPRNRNDYPAAQIRWLKNELKAAAEDAPGMPIFTFQHHHIKDTVYVSRSWYTPDYAMLRKAYGAYPQVINFSGDSHGPMNNPLSIWQEEFTMLNTGTLYYFEMERGMTGGTLPPGKENAAQYYIVEADAAGRVRIRPYNLLTDDFFRTPSNTDDPEKQLIHVIDCPADPSTFLYTPERGKTASAPYFPEDARITLDRVTENSVTVTHTQAKDDQCVYSYRISAETEGRTREVRYFSEYYFEPMPETVSCQVKGLKDGAHWLLKVYPVNAWGVEGEPLTAEFDTPVSEAVPYEADNPVRYAGTFTDFESYKRLRRSLENGVFSGEAVGDYFIGEWNGAGIIRDTVLELAPGAGFEGSTAGAVTVNAGSHSNRGLYLYADEINRNPRQYPDTKYLRVWVDFTGIDFRKACFGFVNEYDELFSTDDIDGRTDLPFWYLPEGGDTWKKMFHGTDGCFGEAQSSSVKDFKGWLAFPTEDFAARTGSGETFESRTIKAVYMYFDLSSDKMLGKPFYLDEIALVGDYTVFEEYGS